MSALINKMLNLVGFDNEEELMEEEGYNSNTSVAAASQEGVKGNYNPFKKNSKVAFSSFLYFKSSITMKTSGLKYTMLLFILSNSPP